MARSFGRTVRSAVGAALLAAVGAACVTSARAQALPLIEQCHRPLGENQSEEVTRALATLTGKDAAARIAAAKTLAAACERRAVAPLLNLLHDPDALVRIAAVEALGKLGDRDTVEELIQLTEDTDWRVRQALGRALCAFQVARASYAALNYIVARGSAQNADDMRARATTAIAIHQLSDVSYSRKALLVLLNHTESENADVRRVAVEALYALKETRNTPFELPALLKQSINPYHRRKAAYWIGELHIERGRDLLTEAAAKDPDAEVRKIAAAALLKLSKPVE